MAKEKAVLAYSGGLDTSIILHWMVQKGLDVTAVMADLGQEADFEAAKIKATAIGASDVVVADVKHEFLVNYVYPAIRANAKYEGRYLLGTSLARPLTAKAQIDVAKEIGASILSHGATGKGNDQVRFEMAYRTLAPECKIWAPWKDREFLDRFAGRSDLIEYAKANGIPVSQSKKDPWSNDDNAMHISYEAGMLENPAAYPFERMFKMTVSPQDAPDKVTFLEIGFDSGTPAYVHEILSFNQDPNTGLMVNEVYGPAIYGPVDLFKFLNEFAGKNGVGRDDIVENRYVGMKSRGVYETPAGTVLHFAHKDLEGITMDRELMRRNAHTSIDLAERIYSGFWFSPERVAMQRDIDSTQNVVTGIVRVGLYKGNIIPMGRSSPCSLYDEKVASMDVAGGYDPTDASGFIKLTALRVATAATRDAKLNR